MSTLTRTNSHSKKPQYKDYVSFLDSYRTGKKDGQNSVVTSDSGVNFSLNSSTNSSSNSVFSDVNETAARTSFKEHLENFNNKKFNSNSILPKSKHTVKTEMFIEIKNPPSSQNFPTQVFEVQKIDKSQESTISVSSAAKNFENKDQIDFKNKSSLKPKQNSFKKSSIGEISKKFEETSQCNLDSAKPHAKRASSIGEVSKLFENGDSQQNGILHKPKNFNSVPKPFQPTSSSKINTEARALVKPAILSPKPIITPAFPKFTPEAPISYADSVDSALSSLSISPSPPQCASPPPSGAILPPPPPPPMPPAIFAHQALVQKQVSKGTSSPHKLSSAIANQQITGQATNTLQTNGQAVQNGTLDRNDPRVKKAVYGALRNMYGAYHDQANDYLATLPKNRVRKNNGLDSIIDSIASQGGLDKLNGRLNPKQEVE